jgi:transposase (fragment)
MIYVGVDIAKLNHFASAISSDGEVLIEPFKFTNDADGFQMLVSKLISLKQSPTASSSVLNQRHTMATNLFDIELLDSQLNKIEDEMTYIMKFNDSVIMTIPGIGYINGGMILGEIGNIHRFSSPCKLLAFAGLDPSVYQSGNFQARRTKMSKRGSKVLRYALINAAHNVVKNNATFKAFYDVKMAEGRTHYNALGHCAGKLVRVIWKMMTNDMEFNLH